MAYDAKKSKLKWTPTAPLRRPDYIKSSIFTERGETGFTPTYDHGRPNLGCLLQYEYFRMWFKERDQYQKDIYSKQHAKKNIFIKRPYVQRCYAHVEKQKNLPIIKLKKFQNVPARESTRREETKEEKSPKETTAPKKDEKESHETTEEPEEVEEKE